MATGSGDVVASPPRATRAPLIAAGVAILALVVVIALLVLTGHGSNNSKASAAPTTTPTPSASASLTVNDIYQRVGPSVTVVRTAKGALGTGVIATAAGAVLTANHVI